MAVVEAKFARANSLRRRVDFASWQVFKFSSLHTETLGNFGVFVDSSPGEKPEINQDTGCLPQSRGSGPPNDDRRPKDDDDGEEEARVEPVQHAKKVEDADGGLLGHLPQQDENGQGWKKDTIKNPGFQVF